MNANSNNNNNNNDQDEERIVAEREVLVRQIDDRRAQVTSLLAMLSSRVEDLGSELSTTANAPQSSPRLASTNPNISQEQEDEINDRIQSVLTSYVVSANNLSAVSTSAIPAGGQPTVISMDRDDDQGEAEEEEDTQPRRLM